MKDRVLVISFLVIIYSFFLINVFSKDIENSKSERRRLHQISDVKNVLDNDFSTSLEEYNLDQFCYRDSFRSLKNFLELNVFLKRDTNNLYVKDGYIFKMNYPLNEKKVVSFAEKMNKLYRRFLKMSNVTFALIPAKEYYTGHFDLDYDHLFDLLKDNLDEDIHFLNLSSALKLDDYYKTDIHWKQEALEKVLKLLDDYLSIDLNQDFKKREYAPFYGSYYGQLNLNINPDKLTYLVSDEFKNYEVKNYDHLNYKSIYTEQKKSSMDLYDVYLGGASSVIEIDTKRQNGKNLVIFRDSFGSSLAPLLLKNYDKITLVDLRYVHLNYLDQITSIDYENADVLMLYNSSIINESDIIKID